MQRVEGDVVPDLPGQPVEWQRRQLHWQMYVMVGDEHTVSGKMEARSKLKIIAYIVKIGDALFETPGNRLVRALNL